MNMVCACGSGVAFEACCEPVLAGDSAVTAEALMRSRYVAFTLGNMDYLEMTQTGRAAAGWDRAEAEAQAPETEWLGLEIVRVVAGGEADKVGSVTFRARYKYQGEVFVQTETSEFVRVDGRWRYEWGQVAADVAQSHRVVKVGRNDQCVCGSGAKFKKCCGA